LSKRLKLVFTGGRSTHQQLRNDALRSRVPARQHRDICASGCLCQPPAQRLFVLAVFYAARQHRGNLCCLFVPLASTDVFGASRCLCCPPEKYFPPFYYIIPHSHLLFLYNSHFVYYLYLAKIFAVFFNIYICRSNSPEFIIICI
jgi:hypothetical protein